MFLCNRYNKGILDLTQRPVSWSSSSSTRAHRKHDRGIFKSLWLMTLQRGVAFKNNTMCTIFRASKNQYHAADPCSFKKHKTKYTPKNMIHQTYGRKQDSNDIWRFSTKCMYKTLCSWCDQLAMTILKSNRNSNHEF